MEKSIQLGFIARLAKELGPNNKLGRKAFQKIVHLSHSLAGIPTGYAFSFYIYGPFSKELSADLELAESVKIISSVQDQSTGTYDIKAGVFADQAEKGASVFLASYQQNFEMLISSFGNKSAKSLELYSTIVFIKAAEPEIANDSVVTTVLKLKPKYFDSEIRSAITEIEDFRNSLH